MSLANGYVTEVLRHDGRRCRARRTIGKRSRAPTSSRSLLADVVLGIVVHDLRMLQLALLLQLLDALLLLLELVEIGATCVFLLLDLGGERVLRGGTREDRDGREDHEAGGDCEEAPHAALI